MEKNSCILDQVYRIHVTWESDVDFYIVLKQDQKITFKETLSFMYDIWNKLYGGFPYV